MICIYLNSNGYYISGDGMEIALSCSPNVDENGDLFYPEQCHIYIVLSKALNELRGKDLPGEVMIYNDSRVIDEMNGTVSPLDELSGELRDRIRREVMPEIGGTVFFRKQNTRTIMKKVLHGRDSMIDVVDKSIILKEIVKQKEETSRSNTLKALDKLKEDWKNVK
jgi:hypothetical protein